MPREYTKLLPLWYYEEKLRLTDQYPSALEWAVTNGWHGEGEMAGRWTGSYYQLNIAGDRLHAHRIVYYMRTGDDPKGADVRHGDDNPERDNRKELFLYQRKKPKNPMTNYWRRDTPAKLFERIYL